MKNGTLTLIAVSLAVVLGSGCEELSESHRGGPAASGAYFEPKYEGPIVPQIAGNWKGSFYLYEYDRDKNLADTAKGARRNLTSITAVVTQNEKDHALVTLVTSRSGRGHRLTGRIEPDGGMTMTDAYDGEIWTTHRRKATAQMVELNDFVYEEEAGVGPPRGLFTILLDEHLADTKEDSRYL